MRAAIAALCTLLTAGLVACGGKEGPKPFTTAQVARAFQQITGDRLVTDPAAGQGSSDVLRLDQGLADATITEQRYGSFSIYVVHGADAKVFYATDVGGDPVRPSAGGIYWRRLSASPPAWQAAKPYRNVVLQWNAGRRKAVDPRFERLDAALSAIAEPDDAEVAPQDRPCAAQGIDPARGRGGTCKLGAQTLVVVNRGRKLRLPTYDLARVRVGVRRVVRSQALVGFARAKGRFVVLRFRVRNRGTEPLERVTPTLVLGRRRYALDDRALFLLQERSPFPVQPGDTAEVVALYDIPARAARRAARRGGLVVDGSPDGAAATIEGASVIGRVRL